MNLITKITSLLCAAAISSSGIIQTGLTDKIKEFLPRAETGEEIENNDITPKRGNSSPTERNKKASAGHDGAVPTSGEVRNWYCKHMNNGERPALPPEMSMIAEHDGYFLGEDEKTIYLTFDAGYENGNIEKILDTLKAENVPAAFFILENLAETNTELVKRMIDEGHTVCNHTARHRDMTKLRTKEEFAAEIEKMEQICRDKTGCEIAKYYRPPEGRFNEDNLIWAQELGYRTVFWSFAYADWDNDNQMSPQAAEDKILKNTHNGEVILLHPTSKTNAEILPDLIKKWKEMGFGFGTLDELTKA